MKIGIIYTCYQMEDLLDRSLPPWIEAKKRSLGGHTYEICAICVPFIGYPLDGIEDNTKTKLLNHLAAKEIDHLISGRQPMLETEARSEALRWLTLGVDKADITIIVDGDEFFLKEDILGAAAYVESQPLTTWFRLPYRNLVFTRNQYLAEPFTPPRIHRVRAGSYRTHSFWADNNVLYGGAITRDLKQDLHFASATIPTHMAYPLHETWLNNARSKSKVKYQLDRWGTCSFRWDESKGGLTWNESYFAARGEAIPEVLRLTDGP